MGFGARLRNGMEKFFPKESPRPMPTRNRLDLNLVKNTMNSSLLSEMVPGLSQPVWGPEISTVGAYSREGYSSQTFVAPFIKFGIQAQALQEDEDVQLAINDLASKVTGGQHYVKGASEEFIQYMEKFTENLQFDTFDTILVKELLWYGNSIWKPRMGIANVNSFDDLLHIPISSFVRIWIDRQRLPYKYELRGAKYQGYFNPGEVLHFKWNPVDGNLFGTGFGVSVTSPRDFEMILPGNDSTDVRLPSMLERKYATQFNMQMAEQRYISKNVWIAEGASADQRSALQSNIEQSQVGQDIVAGTNVDVKELGTQGRNFNAEQFADMTQGPLFKALNDFRGKQAGESTHSYANAERAALLDEIGLTAFPIAVYEQLSKLLFEPWYEAHPFFDNNFQYGMMPVPWDKTDFKIMFGQVEKKDISVEDMIKLIDLYLKSPMPKDPVQINKLFKQAGLPIDENLNVQFEQMYNDPNGQMALNQAGVAPELPPNSDIGGGPITPQFNNQNMGSPPMDNPMYDSMMNDVRGDNDNDNIPGNPFVPTNYRRSNQSQDWNWGSDYE